MREREKERGTACDTDLLQTATVHSVHFHASTVYQRHTYYRPTAPRYMIIASICDVDAFVAHESEKDNILYVETDNVY